MKKTVVCLTFLMFFIFAGLATAGVYMTYGQVLIAQKENTKPNEVKVKVDKDSALFEIKSVCPGLIILFFGVIGLFLLLVRIPVKEVLTFEEKRIKLILKLERLGFYNDTEKPTKISLPVWWILKFTGKYKMAK